MSKKTLLFIPLLLAGVSGQAQTNYAYWSFGATAVNEDFFIPASHVVVTAETFPGTPTLTSTGSENLLSTFQSTPFTAYNSIAYGAGAALAWNPGSTVNSFTLNLDMTHLEDLKIRLDYRGTSSVGFTQFSAIEYSLNNGASYNSAVSSPTLTMNSNILNLTTSQLDFSSVGAIEDQSSVLIRFSMPDVPSGNSFRIDNLQIQATTIPEPGTLALVGVALAALLLFNRRRP